MLYLLFIGFSAFSIEYLYTQKREPTALVHSGLDSHHIQCRKPTHSRERFALFLEYGYSSCREMNESSNKANAYYLCSATLCACLCNFNVVQATGSILVFK